MRMLEIIINPTAGNGLAKKVGGQIVAALTARDIPFRAEETARAGHAVSLAREAAERGGETVVAIGGDGTVQEVARGLRGTQAALGIIPAGTGNDIIKVLGIPKKPVEALDFLLGHPARPVDVGMIDDRLFLNVCGTGIDVMVLEYAYAAKRVARGILPYLWGVLRAVIAYRPRTVTVSYDGGAPQALDVMLVTVGNGRYIGGGINVAPDAMPDDGLLDLLIIESMPKWKVPPHLLKLLNGRAKEIPGAKYIRCKRVSLAGDGMRVQIDGEITPMASAELAVLPGGMTAHW